MSDLKLHALMNDLVSRGGSDLHLTGDIQPYFRIQGQILPASDEKLSQAQLWKELTVMLGETKMDTFKEKKELDCSYGLENVARFRLNVFFDRGKIACVMRALGSKIPNFLFLDCPKTSAAFESPSRPHVGYWTNRIRKNSTGKLDYGISTNHSHHILTVEDPIEFVFNNKNCLVRQREVGEDTSSFSNALRSALREDPDIILVGEMRDLETISLAITAAETGHLVLGTLHTSSASQTIDRIIDVFPTAQQQQIRVQLSVSLIGVISQTLCKTTDKKRKLAAEILVNNNAVSNLIRESKSSQIYSQIQVGGKFGMQTLEQALFQLVDEGLITKEEAFYKCNRPNVLTSLLDSAQ